jgi:hypothetical protein
VGILKEFARKIYKKAEHRLGANTGKIITVILFGILLLVVVIPVDGCSGNSADEADGSSLTGLAVGDSYDTAAVYGQDDSYGAGLFAQGSEEARAGTEAVDIQTISTEAEYYENRLKNILETSYGQGSVQVMVHMTQESEKGLYGDVSEGSIIDGVLVVADVETANELLTISEAVCALFNLPACKVYVIKKS